MYSLNMIIFNKNEHIVIVYAVSVGYTITALISSSYVFSNLVNYFKHTIKIKQSSQKLDLIQIHTRLQFLEEKRHKMNQSTAFPTLGLVRTPFRLFKSKNVKFRSFCF